MSGPESNSAAQLRGRKNSHLELCREEAVEQEGKTTLFEDADLVHQALPEIALDEIDTHVEFIGKTLRVPLVITGMTGGTEEAFAVNRDLASVAERMGIAFGLGSQRVMQRDPGAAWTFDVRKFAPSTLLLGNIGLIQASQQPTAAIEELVQAIGADAICLHLNPAQELIQVEGDRDFRGGVETLARLSRELSVPAIAKETGCGMSAATARTIQESGIRAVDISGAGGTSWVRVEMFRGDETAQRVGATFSDWGIPTAASLAMVSPLGLETIASGGIRNGLEVAKALALGATLGGVALPIYRAYCEGGIPAAQARLEQIVLELKTAMLLTGSRTIAELQARPVVLGPRIRAWLATQSTNEKSLT